MFMFARHIHRKRQNLRRRFPGSSPLRLGVVVAHSIAYAVVFGSYGLAYAIAYAKEVSHAHREGARNPELGRRAKEIGTRRHRLNRNGD